MNRDEDIQEKTGIVKRQNGTSALAEWEGAAARGLAARRERETIIEQVLEPGVDFGIIPGTEKPTLLKPGAEKIVDCLNLCPQYEVIGSKEDWDKGRFFYRYLCRLVLRGTESVVATGVGSCNSLEARYRWRNMERACPSCGKPSVIKGAAKYGGGWLCWKKKGGCGAKFKDGDQSIEGQAAGKIENDDPFSLVNTIDKMAQKRALIAAALNLGFSHKFTQDLEDNQRDQDNPPAEDNNDDLVITEAMRRKLFAKAKEAQKALGWDEAALASRVTATIGEYGYKSTKEIKVGDFDAILDAISMWGES